MASDRASTFGEIEKKIEELRTAENKPHVDAQSAINSKWRPLKERAADLKARLKAIVVTPFQIARDQKQKAEAAAAIAKGADPASLPERRETFAEAIEVVWGPLLEAGHDGVFEALLETLREAPRGGGVIESRTREIALQALLRFSRLSDVVQRVSDAARPSGDIGAELAN